MKKIPIKNIKRFITTLAFFNETYPDKNPLINRDECEQYMKHINNMYEYLHEFIEETNMRIKEENEG